MFKFEDLFTSMSNCLPVLYAATACVASLLERVQRRKSTTSSLCRDMIVIEQISAGFKHRERRIVGFAHRELDLSYDVSGSNPIT